MPRHSLSNEEFEIIRPHLPAEKTGTKGRPFKSHWLILDAIFWILTAGTPWRDLPQEFGPWKTVYNRFRRWSADGTWDQILIALQQNADEKGLIDWELWCVDGTISRAHKSAAGVRRKPPQDLGIPGDQLPMACLEGNENPEALGRSRGGFSTKSHFVTDGQGIPLVVGLTGGHRHESPWLEELVTSHALGDFSENKPDALAGDRAYNAERIRTWLEGQEIEDVIPVKKNEEPREGFDKEKYKQRNVVERAIGRLKEYRRIATRYEKRAWNFLAMIHLAMIRIFTKLHLRDTV